ncbi:unnamed protein product [Candida verbasci]|uniref:Thioredoxin domain-containing protein n=1 Tax=Candida verbasci TaxID=1227364 RepID=A0A9W4XER6_9ASCO|nr:unnamed protein product [Candida verbasci]
MKFIQFIHLLSLLSIVISLQDSYTLDSNIFELTSSNFNKVIHNSNYTSIVKFYAPWCQYCQKLKPVWTKLGKFINDSKYSINVASVNCDKDYNKQLCSQYKISGFPTLMVFRPPKFSKGAASVNTKNHASEVYNGERSVKSIVNFITSRIKNYVKKFHNINSDGLKEWLEEKEGGGGVKVLLITKANSISPLLKSLAIDYLNKVDFAMIGKLNEDSKLLEIDGVEVTIAPSTSSTLLYYDKEDHKFIKYEESKKLNDKLQIEKWISKISNISPVEGPLSKKGKKFSKYRGVKKVEHDEL